MLWWPALLATLAPCERKASFAISEDGGTNFAADVHVARWQVTSAPNDSMRPQRNPSQLIAPSPFQHLVNPLQADNLVTLDFGAAFVSVAFVSVAAAFASMARGRED